MVMKKTLSMGIIMGNLIAGSYFLKAEAVEKSYTSYAKKDVNRDRKIDSKDYKLFASNWKREGIVEGKDPNDLGANCDFNKNGKVDLEDLAIFAKDWLLLDNPNLSPKSLEPWYRDFLNNFGIDPNDSLSPKVEPIEYNLR